MLAVVAAVAERSLVLNLAYCTVQILDVWAYTFTRDTSPIIGHQCTTCSRPFGPCLSRAGSRGACTFLGCALARARGGFRVVGKLNMSCWSTRVHTQIIQYSVECTRSAALEGGAGLTRQVQRAGVEPLKGGVQDGHLRVTGLGFGGWVRSRVRFYQGLGLRRGCVQDGHLLSEAALGRGLCGLVEAGACGGEQARDRGPPALRVPG